MAGKGRKPKPDAIRRGGVNPLHLKAEPVEVVPLEKPPIVAASASMSACWDMIVTGSPVFQPVDEPALEAYCYWYAVLQQCEANTLMEDGRVVLTYAQRDEEGNPIMTTARRNPDVQTAEKATAMLRLLGSELNLTPSGRARAGLMDAMTKSTQADVIAKTAQALARFKEQQANAGD